MRSNRQRRTSKRGQFKKSVALLVAGMACVGYLFVAGKLGVTVGNFVTPIFSNNVSHQTVQAVEQNNAIETVEPITEPVITAKATVTESNEKQNVVTESINLEGKTLYCVQIGAFSDENNAEIAASTLRKRGAAGYILQEKYWRVLVAGYLKEEDAKTVKEQLEQSGIENTIYNIEYQSLSFDITADEALMKDIKSLFKTYQDCMNMMHETAMALDQEKISQSEAVKQVEQAKNNMEKSIIILQEMIDNLSGDNEVLNNLLQVYEGAVQKTQKIINSKELTKVELSSILKYNYIDMFLALKSYMNQF